MKMTVEVLRRYTLGVLMHALLVLVWYLTVRYGEIPKFIMPSPQETVATLWDGSYNWVFNTWVTSKEIFGGYFFAAVSGERIPPPTITGSPIRATAPIISSGTGSSAPLPASR